MELFKSSKTLSIDFGADEIKIVEGKVSKKGIVINKNFFVKLPEEVYKDGEISDMDKMTYLLKAALSQNKIAAGEVHGVIKSSNIIMREITMPKVSDDNIESMLSYQLEDYIPIHTEDYVVKFIKCGFMYEDNVEKVILLLIGIPRNIVEAHFNLLKSVNLNPVVLDYQGNAINKLINIGDSINEKYTNKDTVTNIDIGFDSTSLTISSNGTIRVSRIIEGGANSILESLGREFDLPKDDLMKKIMNIQDVSVILDTSDYDYNFNIKVKNALKEIIDRIEMIFRYYRTRELGNEINLVLLHGGLSNIPGIEKLFTSNFNIPCLKLNSISNVKFEDDLSKYANAIGGLIRLDGVRQ